ncbi:MAG: PAS domain-containing protein [Egibacteraceae bacterium]
MSEAGRSAPAVADETLAALGIGVVRVRRDAEGTHRILAACRPPHEPLPEGCEAREEQLPGAALADTLPPATAEAVAALLAEAEETGTAERDPVEVAWREGAERWYRFAAAREDDGALTVLVLDVTSARTQRSSAAQVAAERAAVVGALRDAVVILDASRRVVDANEAAEAMLGTPLAGRSWEEIRERVGMERLSEPGARLLDLVLSGREAPPVDVRFVAPGGREVDAAVIVEPLRVDGEIVGAVVLLEDVSEARRLEDERSRLIEGLLSRQDDLSRDLASALHDGPVQTLTQALMTVGMARDFGDALDPETLQTLLERAAGELRGLMGELASAPVGEGLSVALGDLVADWMAEDHHAAIALSGPELPRLPPAREALVYRVAVEAVRNARKHAPDSPVRIRQGVEDGQVVVTISDEGPGCSLEDQQRAAESGHLGLVLSRERMTAAGGTMTIDADASGTRVELRAPASRLGDSGPDHRDDPSRRGERAPGSGARAEGDRGAVDHGGWLS